MIKKDTHLITRIRGGKKVRDGSAGDSRGLAGVSTIDCLNSRNRHLFFAEASLRQSGESRDEDDLGQHIDVD